MNKEKFFIPQTLKYADVDSIYACAAARVLCLANKGAFRLYSSRTELDLTLSRAPLPLRNDNLPTLDISPNSSHIRPFFSTATSRVPRLLFFPAYSLLRASSLFSTLFVIYVSILYSLSFFSFFFLFLVFFDIFNLYNSSFPRTDIRVFLISFTFRFPLYALI